MPGSTRRMTPVRVSGLPMAALTLLMILGGGSWVHAGAWTQSRGGYYGRVAFAGIDTEGRFDGDGERIAFQTSGTIARNGEYRSREIRGYGEYGVLERLTAYGSLTYKRVAVEDLTTVRETYGFSDLDLGGRYRLTPDGLPPVSVAAEARVPTGYSTDDNPALGAGQFDGTVKLLAGVSSAGWYATGDVGWMARGGRYQDQFVGSLEAGGRASRYGGRTVLRWAQSVGGEEPAGLGFDPALASPRMLMLDAALAVETLPGVNLEFALSHVLTGRSALAGNTLEVALVRSGRLGANR